MKSTKPSSHEIHEMELETASRWMDSAQRIIVGAGSGLSASGGLQYNNRQIVEKWFPEYGVFGFTSLLQIQSYYWTIEGSDLGLYWGYWAQHIWHIRFEPEALRPYRDLHQLLRGKKHFIITTNVDGQFVKAGFDDQEIFAPQGDYSLFQCSRPCRNVTYPNRDMIDTMVKGLWHDHNGLPRIRHLDIPKCPNCGAPLMPNLRCDNRFVETGHMDRAREYQAFLTECISSSEPTLLLELGVGFNTPGVIRYPFEHFARRHENFHLLRINLSDASIRPDLEHKALALTGNLGTILSSLSHSLNSEIPYGILQKRKT